jgi:hypothetical protein
MPPDHLHRDQRSGQRPHETYREGGRRRCRKSMRPKQKRGSPAARANRRATRSVGEHQCFSGPNGCEFLIWVFARLQCQHCHKSCSGGVQWVLALVPSRAMLLRTSRPLTRQRRPRFFRVICAFLCVLRAADPPVALKGRSVRACSALGARRIVVTGAVASLWSRHPQFHLP